MLMQPVFSPDSLTPDHRFSNLLGDGGWMRLSPAIRRRFGKRVKGGDSVAYQGKVIAMQMNLAGKILAQAARLIGAPLPYDVSCVGQPAVVTVTEDIAGEGQFWIRQYGRKAGFPQVVHSSKRFAGPTGLEEYIGFGIGMALRVESHAKALLFKSEHYFIQVLGRRIRLPKFLSPGALTIGHHDLGNGRFMFTLHLCNRLLGTLIQQEAVFDDGKV